MNLDDQQRYRALKRLYQFHKKRQHYDLLFHMVLPKTIYIAFMNRYRINRMTQFNFGIGIIKTIIFGMMMFFVFKLLNLSELFQLMMGHVFFTWIYISSMAYQLNTQMAISKQDLLMHMIGDYKKKLYFDEIKEKLRRSYWTSLVPLTLFSAFLMTVNEGNLVGFLGFVVFQGIGYVLTRFMVLILYDVKYVRLRHSFFKDFLISSGIWIMFALIGFVLSYPTFFLIENSYPLWVYLAIFGYGLGLILSGYFLFNPGLTRYLERRFINMLYPSVQPRNKQKSARFMDENSVWLKGLDAIEKAIVIKDQKTFKRKNLKDYYSAFFYAPLLVLVSVQYAFGVRDQTDFMSLLLLSMVFVGTAFLMHMSSTSMLSNHIAYASEGALTLTYHRLHVAPRQIFRAKLRLYQRMLVQVLIVVIGSSLIIIQPSIERVGLFLFSVLYYVALTRFKLRHYVFSDTQNRKAHIHSLPVQSIGMGTSFMIGLFFMIAVPIGFFLMAQLFDYLLGINGIYGMTAIYLSGLWIANWIQDRRIRLKQSEGTYDYN